MPLTVNNTRSFWLQKFAYGTTSPHRLQSKEEGKDQESIQSSTTPDPGHHMRK